MFVRVMSLCSTLDFIVKHVTLLGQCCTTKNTWSRNKKLSVVEFTFSHSLQCH